ncbi:MAG: TAXI family TRAP transporter solute-binding subunit, partial [Actinomycetes bacterium]
PTGSLMRGRLRKFVVVLLTAFALAAAGWLVARPSARAPRAIVMATGPAGGSYAALGERYREILARYGLRVELRATEGDGENLALLQDPASGVSVAFLQSGITSEEGSPGLESLGAMLIQPVWVFRHGESPRFGLGDLEGRAVSVGSERSGTRAAALRLLATCARVGAEEGERLGLIEAIVPAAEQLAWATALAEQMLDSDRYALAEIKAALRDGDERSAFLRVWPHRQLPDRLGS